MHEVIDSLDEAFDVTEEIQDQISESYDKMPVNFQDTDRGEAMQKEIDDMDEIMKHITDLKNEVFHLIK